MTGVLTLTAPPVGPAPSAPFPPAGDWVCEGPAWAPIWPVVPDVVDWDAPDEIPDVSRPRRVQVAVRSIIDGAWLGELLTAQIESRSEDLDGVSGSIEVSVPTSDPSLLETLLGKVQDWAGRVTGTLDPVIDRAVHPVIDGKVATGYVLRGEAGVRGGRLHLAGQEAGRLWQDRVLGAPERDDLLDGRGWLPGTGSWRSLGFTWTGSPSDIEWIPGPRHDTRGLRIRGSRLAGDRLVLSSHLVMPSGVTDERITVRSSALLRLPDGTIPQTDLMATEVWSADGSTRISPVPGQPNFHVAQADEDTPTGGTVWPRSPWTSAALLPKPPYTVRIDSIVYPQSSTEWTWVSGLRQFRRDTLSTGVERDLVEQVAILIRESQTRPGKSSWSMPVDLRERSGVAELGVWRDEDEIPLPEAIAQIVERDDGPDPPWVDPRWRAQIGHRRGRVRDDLRLSEVEMVSHDGWTHDPGSMVSELRGLTDQGDAYWRVSSVATDTSRTNGHVIEAMSRAPNDLPLMALDMWTVAQLATLAQPQETTRFVVPGWLGRRIGLGDSFEVLLIDGLIRLHRRMRLARRTILDRSDLHVFDMGGDE